MAGECEYRTGNGEEDGTCSERVHRQQLKDMQSKLDATIRKQTNAHSTARKPMEKQTLAEASGSFYGFGRDRPLSVSQVRYVSAD